jgi:hypothetical protein
MLLKSLLSFSLNADRAPQLKAVVGFLLFELKPLFWISFGFRRSSNESLKARWLLGCCWDDGHSRDFLVL